MPWQSASIFAAGPTRIGVISPFCAGLDRAGERRFLAGMRYSGRDRLQFAQRSKRRSYFPVPGFMRSP